MVWSVRLRLVPDLVRRLLPIAAIGLVGLSLGGCGSFQTFERAQLSDEECLARVMYFESLRSSDDGMLAVGTVVMNRLANPRYPKTVCGVVGQNRQFADGALTKHVDKRSASWKRATRIAGDVLGGERHDQVGSAMFFHTVGYSFPYRNMKYVTLAGGNAFYEKRTPGTFENTIDPVRGTTMLARAETPVPAREREKPVQLAEADEDDVAPAPVRPSLERAARAERARIVEPDPVSAAHARTVVAARREAVPRRGAEARREPEVRREAEPDMRHTTIVAKSAPLPRAETRLAAAPAPRGVSRDMPLVAAATARSGSTRLAALQPPARGAAEPARPIVVASLAVPAKPRAGRARSIEDLIAMDLAQQ